MNTAPIGVFDSGSGGLSILLSLTTMLPRESFIYIGDHLNNPYGGKDRAFIQKRTIACIDFLREKHVKLVVIACNTSTVAGIDDYRKLYPDLPIVGVVPVVKTAATVSKTKHIVILSTEYTAKSAYQQKLIDTFAQHCVVTNIGSTTLVPLIEKGDLNGREIADEIHAVFHKMHDTKVDVVVLGCTHYPFIRDMIQKEVGAIQILDSSDAVARQVTRIVTARNELSDGEGKELYFTTGDEQAVSSVCSTLLHKPIRVTHVTL